VAAGGRKVLSAGEEGLFDKVAAADDEAIGEIPHATSEIGRAVEAAAFVEDL